MPAAAPLLAHRRVLRAAHRNAELVARDTDVAADALANVVEPAFLDLARQERIGDRRPCGADEIEHALADERGHVIGRGVAADADHRLAGQALDEGDVGLLIPFFGEARRRAVVLPGADIDVPQIGQVGEHGDDVPPLPVAGDAVRTQQLVDGDPHADGAGIADRVLRVLDQLAQQPGPVLETAAVLVDAMVVAPRQEMHRQREIVAGIDIDEVEPGLARVQGGAAMPKPIVADVVLVHRTRRDRHDAEDRPGRRGDRNLARLEIADAVAVMDELDPGEAVMRVNELGRACEVRNVLLVPEPDFLRGVARWDGCRTAQCRRPPSRLPP